MYTCQADILSGLKILKLTAAAVSSRTAVHGLSMADINPKTFHTLARTYDTRRISLDKMLRQHLYTTYPKKAFKKKMVTIVFFLWNKSSIHWPVVISLSLAKRYTNNHYMNSTHTLNLLAVRSSFRRGDSYRNHLDKKRYGQPKGYNLTYDDTDKRRVPTQTHQPRM